MKLTLTNQTLAFVIATIYGLLPICLWAVYPDFHNSYFDRPTDLSEDYFYGGLSLLKLGQIYQPTHPGTPAHAVMAIVQLFFDAPVENAAVIFSILWLFVALMMGIAVYYLLRFCSDVTIPFVALAISPLFLWPPFVTYIFTYGADSLILPFAVILTAIVWQETGRKQPRSPAIVALTGAMSAIAISLKVSMLIIVSAALTSLFIYRLMQDRALPVKWLGLLAGGAIVGTFLGFGPVIWNSATYVQYIVAPPDYLKSSDGLLDGFANLMRLLSDFSPVSTFVYAGMSIFVVAAIIVTTIVFVSRPDDRPTAAARLVFVAVLLVGFSRTISLLSSDLTFNLGVSLRNSSPAIILYPVGFMLLVWGLSRLSPWFANWCRSRQAGLFVGILAVSFVSIGMVAQGQAWEQLFSSREAARQKIDAALGSLPKERDMIVSVDTPTEFFFHVHGNQQYAGNHFDHDLKLAFPRHTTLRTYFQRTPSTPLAINEASSFLDRLRNLRRIYFPEPPTARDNRMFMRMDELRRFGALVIRRSSLKPTKCDMTCLLPKLASVGLTPQKVIEIPAALDDPYFIIKF